MDENILKILPMDIRRNIEALDLTLDITEIRLRVGKNIYIRCGTKEKMIPEKVNSQMLITILKNISNSSIYAIQNDINSGFLTIKGGHRVGVTGEIIIANGVIKNIKYICSMNIRVARQIIGVADKILNNVIQERELKNTLIISPPGCGKTTLLRDLVRKISYAGFNVGVIDERGEIACMSMGEYTLDVGPRTDVLSYCPKWMGINMLIRSMAPDVIATDEIGSKEDIGAIRYAYISGVKFLFTMHGTNLEDVKKNEEISKMCDEGYFDNIIVLSNSRGIGTIEKIHNNVSSIKTVEKTINLKEVI